MSKNVFSVIEKKITEKRDNQLIQDTLSGNSKSFDKLISLYRSRITALGMSFFKNTTDTDDFVQEVFVKIYTSLSQFRAESSFATWITRIAYNMAVNTINRRKEYAAIPEDAILTDPDYTPEQKQIRSITIDAVHEAMQELPEHYAMCIELYFFYDTPYDEIARITKFPVNTIKSHIFRAKKILKEKLRGYYEKDM